MCIPLDFVEEIKDWHDWRRSNAMMRAARKKLPDPFNPEHLERLRERKVELACKRLLTVDEMNAITKTGKPLRVCDIVYEGPIPDHLATRELQWKCMLQGYQNSLQNAEKYCFTSYERRDGTYVEEPWSPEKIRDYKGKCLVMIDALKKKIDDEATVPAQRDAISASWSE